MIPYLGAWDALAMLGARLVRPALVAGGLVGLGWLLASVLR